MLAIPHRALIASVTVFVALFLAGCSETGSSTAADCNGTNGNAAVAACHPDNQGIQDACPDNSGGDAVAAPSDECLQAVRDSN